MFVTCVGTGFLHVFKSRLKSLTMQSLLQATLFKKTLGNIVGKEENAGNQHFLLFRQCFLTFQ